MPQRIVRLTTSVAPPIPDAARGFATLHATDAATPAAALADAGRHIVTDTFIVLLGHVMCELPLRAAVSRHYAANALFTMLV